MAEADAAAARDIHVFTIMITGGPTYPSGGCDNGGGPQKYFDVAPAQPRHLQGLAGRREPGLAPRRDRGGHPAPPGAVVPFRAPLDPGHLFFVAVRRELARDRDRSCARCAGASCRSASSCSRRGSTGRARSGSTCCFALVNQALYGVLVTGAALGADRAAEAIAGAAGRLGVAPPGLAFGPLAAAALLAALFVARDFGVFAAHALQHRVPLLWAFHKVHHTTTALTPLSALRAHPVDDVFGARGLGEPRARWSAAPSVSRTARP